ncbi:CopG family transcriptional regulator, partial [Campylobacter jejuni]
SKKIDKIVKNLQEDSNDNELGDFDFAIEALEELKDGDYQKARKKIDKIVKNPKQQK